MTVRVDDQDDVLILTVAGDVDGLTTPRLTSVVADAFDALAGRTLVLDLTKVKFLGSTGLRMLREAAREAVHHRGVRPLRIVVDQARPVIRRSRSSGSTRFSRCTTRSRTRSPPAICGSAESWDNNDVPPSSERQLGNDPTRADVAPAMHLVLAADWISPSVARDRVRAWLRANNWSPAHTDDLVLAINEAVSNSIEHGYRIGPDDLPSQETVAVNGVIRRTEDGSRRAEFTVRDHGRWQPPNEHAPSVRGQGIRLMRACVEHLTIDGGDDGTTVVMHSMTVPV